MAGDARPKILFFLVGDERSCCNSECREGTTSFADERACKAHCRGMYHSVCMPAYFATNGMIPRGCPARIAIWALTIANCRRGTTPFPEPRTDIRSKATPRRAGSCSPQDHFVSARFGTATLLSRLWTLWPVGAFQTPGPRSAAPVHAKSRTRDSTPRASQRHPEVGAR